MHEPVQCTIIHFDNIGITLYAIIRSTGSYWLVKPE